jgi:hypothetical protein
MTGKHNPFFGSRFAIAFSLSIVAGFAVSSARAEDHDSRLEAAFGSTIVSTYPDGQQAELWLRRDGTYEAEGRRRNRMGGVWQIKQDKGGLKLCLKQLRPFSAPFSYCPAVPEGGIDKPWSGKAYTGEPINIRVVRGIFDPAKGGQPSGGQKVQASPDGGGG